MQGCVALKDGSIYNDCASAGCTVQRQRVSWYDLKPFLYISRNSSVVLQDRPLEKDLNAAVGAYYHKLTHFADQYRSHYDKKAKRRGPFLMHDNARKHMTNQTKRCSSTFDVIPEVASNN